MTTAAEWRALAEQCRTAKDSDREIDLVVHKIAYPWMASAICEWRPFNDDGMGNLIWRKPDGIKWYTTDVGNYTESLDAITALIEDVMPGGKHGYTKHGELSSGMVFIHGEGIEKKSTTPALALCAAFCEAMAAKAEKEDSDG